MPKDKKFKKNKKLEVSPKKKIKELSAELKKAVKWGAKWSKKLAYHEKYIDDVRAQIAKLSGKKTAVKKKTTK